MNLIVATDIVGGIGKEGKIPWRNSEDMIRFKRITKGAGRNCVIMGRKTWDSIGKKLPNRINIVLSRNLVAAAPLERGPDFIARNKDEVLVYLNENKDLIDETFVIGGQKIYDLFEDNVNKVYLTMMGIESDCDTFFPLKKLYNTFEIIDIEPKFISSDRNIGYSNLIMVRNEVARPPLVVRSEEGGTLLRN